MMIRYASLPLIASPKPEDTDSSTETEEKALSASPKPEDTDLSTETEKSALSASPKPEDTDSSTETEKSALSASPKPEDIDSRTETEESDDGSENDFQEFDLSDVSVEDIFAELTKILPMMATQVTINHASYLDDAVEKYKYSVEADRLGRHLSELNFVELFQQYWKENFESIVTETCDPIDWMTAEALLQVMWTMSDKCTTICERILKVELHSDLLNFLESQHLKPNRMDDEKPSSIVQAFIGFIHNVVQKPSGARESLRACNAVERIQPFRECSNRMVSCVSLMIQSYLVTEAENEKINSDEEVFELLVRLLDAAIKQEFYNDVKFAVYEVLEVLNKLAANDKNKYRIVKSGALPYYVDLLGQKWTPREQAEAAHGLWILAFKCKGDINKQSGSIEALRALLESSDEKVKKEAEGALWILEEENKPNRKAEAAGGQIDDDDGHIFISYQWDSKATVLKIRDRLKAEGFRVWIDEDDMSGSVMDAMARAVEKAAVVITCLSQRYKDSPNCRSEAEYTFRLKKKIAPIRLQTKYYPDGWLGIMVGSKLVLDFSDSSKVQENMNHLIKELGVVGKGMDETDLVKSVVVPVNNALNYSSHDKTSPVKFWTKDDFNEWMTKNGLQHLKNWFSSFNGALLLEYNAMRNEAPESFFAYLMKNNISLSDALAISLALKTL